MEMERQENHSEEQASSSHIQETNEPSLMPTSQMEPSASGTGLSFSLLPKALSAVLHPTMPPEHSTDQEPATETSSNLEQLQTELRVLRGQFEQMKSQHNKEIKLLMNELDEEKRIRLTLQMEIQHIKKHMSK